jgi:hypothetical protein
MGSVIIHEFEVEAQPPDSVEETPRGDSVPPPALLDAHKIARIVRHHKDRAMRVWAH